MLAELAEAAREIDLRRGIPRQERGGTFQRLARLGEATELQPDLAQEVKRAGRNWAVPRRPAQTRLRPPAKSPRAAQLQAVAAERLDLLVGECHARL